MDSIAKRDEGEEIYRSSRHFGQKICLLTSAFRLLHCKNEGDSGDVYENKGRKKQVSGVRCQVSGKKFRVRCPKSEVENTKLSGTVILSPDSCLLPLKNEGASGDIYENKGEGK